MKKKESALSNTKIAIIFFVFLGFIAFLSLAFKAILVVNAGQFDDSRRFTLSLSDNKNLEAMSLSPSTKSIVIFELPKDIKSNAVGRFLEVPIDGFIVSNSLDLNQKPYSLFLNSILKYKSLQTNLTVIDLLKLFLFTSSIPESSVDTKSISGDLEGAELDKIVGRLVNDELIEKDNQTIQIINGTDVGGLGNRLARLLTNMGGDVIIVATAQSPKKNSTIAYIDKKTYTVERLSKVLGYEVIASAENVIADITITIGEDRINSSPF